MLQKIEHLRKHNILAEVYNQRHKSNHLALEVKTFFGNSTPTTGSSTQSLDFPLTAVISIAERERESKRNLRTTVKAKPE
jgi:hypothetical protein